MDTFNNISKIFSCNVRNDIGLIDEIFQFQYKNNRVYKNWCDLIVKTKRTPNQKKILINNYPFLPISFFKTHEIKSTEFHPQQIFESSGTTNLINSKHFIKDSAIYKASFINCFKENYGNINEYCIIGLLPSYLERKNSSLVFMVDELIKLSNNSCSGFFLNNFSELHETLKLLEQQAQKTIVIGVTFALLDFAEQFPMKLNHTIIIETGGMKGRKAELTKNETHAILKKQLGLSNIDCEYGMTELLSQAYAKENNIYRCPNWMKVFVRDEEDPLQIKPIGKGVLNIIDLANVYSCSFIATDDVGEVFEDGSFEIFGRLDNSDLRGCSLMLQNI